MLSVFFFFSSRRRHTRCALVTEFRRVLFRSRRGRPMPQRSDIDPLHLPASVWPNLLLAEPVAGSSAMRYRLVGSAHVERYTFDFTGRTTTEIMQGSYRTSIEAISHTSLQEGMPEIGGA